jgi:3-hydroxy acid dehydrogenase / malonic semialdehyde reductase
VAALDGRTAIVTGASSGIGAATARGLAREGARVVVGARRYERLQELGSDFFPIEVDVVDRDSAARFVEAAMAEIGRVDILVNGAGLALGREPFWESTEDEEETVLETNVHAVVRMTRLCLPHMTDHGHIVNIGSVAGRQAYPNGAIYVTSKFAVRGFTYALREDLLGRPIRITTVDAGLVETEFSIVRFRGDRQQAKDVYKGVEPLTAEDVADCIMFAVTRPPHVNIDEVVIMARAQSSGARVFRSE